MSEKASINQSVWSCCLYGKGPSIHPFMNLLVYFWLFCGNVESLPLLVFFVVVLSFFVVVLKSICGPFESQRSFSFSLFSLQVLLCICLSWIDNVQANPRAPRPLTPLCLCPVNPIQPCIHPSTFAPVLKSDKGCSRHSSRRSALSGQ